MQIFKKQNDIMHKIHILRKQGLMDSFPVLNNRIIRERETKMSLFLRFKGITQLYETVKKNFIKGLHHDVVDI